MTRPRRRLALLASLALATMTSPAPALGPPARPLPRGAVARFGSALQWHRQKAHSYAFSPDGKLLASLSRDGEGSQLWLWRVADGALQKRFALPAELMPGLIYAPDGRSVVAWGRDAVRVIDVRTGEVTRVGCPDEIASVALSLDGKVLAVGSDQRRPGAPCPVHRWELPSGKYLGRLRGHTTPVLAVAFSGDGRQLFSFSERRKAPPGSASPDEIPEKVCVWDLPAGKLRRHFRPRGELARFAPGGGAIALSDSDKSVAVWDVKTGKRRAALPVESASFLYLPGGKVLATGDWRGVVCLWDVATGKKRRQFRIADGEWARLLAVSPDGKVLVVTTTHGLASDATRLWDLPAGKELRPAGGHTTRLTCLALSPDGRTLVSGSANGLMCVWDVRTGKELRGDGSHPRRVTALAFSPDGRRVASGDASSAVHVWSARSGERSYRVKGSASKEADEADRVGVRAITWSSDGRRLYDARIDRAFEREGPFVSLRPSGALSVRSARTGKSLLALSGRGHAPVTIAPGGRSAVFGDVTAPDFFDSRWQPVVKRLPGGAALARIEAGAEGDPGEVVSSADGKALAIVWTKTTPRITGPYFPPGSYRSKQHLLLHESATGQPLLTIDPPGTPLAFSPDGRLLALGGAELTIRLVDVETGKERGQLTGHLAKVTCAVFSPDGKMLYTGSEDRTALAWDVARFAAPKAKPGALSRGDLDRLWLDLADGDAKGGAAAVRALAAAPGEGVALLRARLRPVAAVPAATTARWLDDLASDAFRERRRAERALESLGERAEPALLEALEGELELDTRLRIERLLTKRDEGLSPDALRALRATTALERMNTPEARKLLVELAKGAPGALLTEEVAASLRRLKARGESK